MRRRHTAEFWIDTLQLEPHPEGGFFKEIYRAPEILKASHLPKRYSGDRSFGTSIYFLLRSQDVSRFHRLQSDEIWHFYAGSSVNLHLLDMQSGYSTQTLGDSLENGDQFQISIPHHTWFGATVNASDSFTLVGCTMSPGFDFADFELAERDSLLQQFPGHRTIIERLT